MNWLRPLLGTLAVIGGCAHVPQPTAPPAPLAPPAPPAASASSATREAAPASGTAASTDQTPPAATHPPATTRAAPTAPTAALPPLTATQPVAVKHSAAATATASRKPPPAAPPIAGTAPPVAAPVPKATAPAAPPLDLVSLQQRLRATPAIGVFTKLSLKNQVDDLLAQFKGYFAGTLKLTLADLRQRYEQLLLKVLTLLQDGDPNLAAAVQSSKEAIWGVLTDKSKLESL